MIALDFAFVLMLLQAWLRNMPAQLEATKG